MVKFTFPAFFFNRTKEIKQITTTLSFQKPQLTVMLGPPSSGKTALMRHVIEQKDNTKQPLFHPIRIDLRSVDISAQDSLYSSILKQVSGPNWNLFKKLKSVKMEAPGDLAVTADFIVQKPSNLIDLLDVLKSKFRPFSMKHGLRPVVLVVDEANEFKNLKNKDDLRTFLRFAVEVSKQESKCHVVFTSSDSFFESWLEKGIYFVN
jgi:AAA+ ATPase superfamily predicted ATPase